MSDFENCFYGETDKMSDVITAGKLRKLIEHCPDNAVIVVEDTGDDTFALADTTSVGFFNSRDNEFRKKKVENDPPEHWQRAMFISMKDRIW